ncbi:MAG TPA: sulfatase-like hydrolase/transferase, partial [Bacteroidales bacterium]|nr:sulfatase-like hydrolase/transferase [Bacteroidales bacterium]
HNVQYAAMVEAVDENVGKVMGLLDSLKIADNTLVIFTSDNGGLSVKEGPRTPATTNSPYRGGKGYIYEGGIREPFIVWWPKGIKDKGVVSNSPVIGCDVFPTIADLLDQEAGDVDGVSLLPQIKNSEKLPERALFWHYPHYSNQGGTPASAVRKGRYKLIQFLEDGHYELYDLVSDRTETKDIAGSMPGKVKELSELLLGWRQATGAKMPVPNPEYQPQSN